MSYPPHQPPIQHPHHHRDLAAAATAAATIQQPTPTTTTTLPPPSPPSPQTAYHHHHHVIDPPTPLTATTSILSPNGACGFNTTTAGFHELVNHGVMEQKRWTMSYNVLERDDGAKGHINKNSKATSNGHNLWSRKYAKCVASVREDAC
ncbi:hypothetical protein Tco_1216442 [Tanacetum coccineum]